MISPENYKIFISYSHHNKDIADKFSDNLRALGYDVWIDSESIPFTVEWWKEIQRGITSADSVIFIASPYSVASPVCHLELDYARSLAKRLIPIIIEDISFDDSRVTLSKKHLSEHTRHILKNRDILSLVRDNEVYITTVNWLFARTEAAFSKTFESLDVALQTDFDHLRLHTQLSEKASKWNNNQKKSSLLLLRGELRQFSEWYKTATELEKKPEPNGLQVDYLLASKRYARIEGWRRAVIAISGTILALIVGVWVAIEFLAPEEVKRLDGNLNIALLAPEDPEANWLFDHLQNAISQAQEQYPEQKIAYYPKLDSTPRQWDSLKDLANDNDLNADFAIQVKFVNQYEVVVELYVTEHVSRSIEFAGKTQFGEPIPVMLPLDSGSKADLEPLLTQRLDSLIVFSIALGQFKQNHWNTALNDFFHFYELVDDAHLRALGLIWIGNTILEWDDDIPFNCPLIDDAIRTLECAHIAYEKALENDPDLWRAHIGLGNIQLDQAEIEKFGIRITNCAVYPVSVGHYLDAVQDTGTPLDDAITQQKAYYNAGVAYTNYYVNKLGGECSGDAADIMTIGQEAEVYLEAAIAAAERLTDAGLDSNIDSTHLLINTYYELAYLQRNEKKYSTALVTIEIADDLLEQVDIGSYEIDLRFNLYVERIANEISLAVITEDYSSAMSLVSGLYDEVVAENLRGENYLERTLFLRGTLYADMGDIEAARADFVQVQKLSDSDNGLYEDAQEELDKLQ